MSLLFTSRPLVVNPELAVRIGLNEAILLQQVHYWLNDTSSGVERDGRRWIYNSLEKWCVQFPFLSASTIKRGFASLKSKGLIEIEQLSEDPRDKTNFYSINYGNELLSGQVKLNQCKRSKRKIISGHIESMDKVKLNQCSESERPDLIGSNWSSLHTETTTETTQRDCQADELPDDIDEPALKVLNHLNKTTGARFQDGQTTMGFINGLLVGEYVADELILVIDHRNEMWGADQKMSQYLRPSTIFDFKAFEEYLPLARKWDEEGRPSSREPEVDATERDSAYSRFMGRGLVNMPKSALEIGVRKLASHAGVKNQSPEISKRTWDRLWAESAKAESGKN
ncbi:conserved phage C-terminal domain-containing protein [Cedecea sp. FDAARGOS_727]|uniref:conserved phage C-terminal domain-containing protein n=1 Tax=Cedecea sp. FDAARGOS_727 TaxID=2545798 RepID=UPI00143E23F7|nr:conserved phage C-terminal domain-containing protein [Cedecea sp. FDAARGOS_727]QIX97432.1 hypothetical protein FOC35_17840 [Cedecea sp. FDAARGOS_727]